MTSLVRLRIQDGNLRVAQRAIVEPNVANQTLRKTRLVGIGSDVQTALLKCECLASSESIRQHGHGLPVQVSFYSPVGKRKHDLLPLVWSRGTVEHRVFAGAAKLRVKAGAVQLDIPAPILRNDSRIDSGNRLRRDPGSNGKIGSHLQQLGFIDSDVTCPIKRGNRTNGIRRPLNAEVRPVEAVSGGVVGHQAGALVQRPFRDGGLQHYWLRGVHQRARHILVRTNIGVDARNAIEIIQHAIQEPKNQVQQARHHRSRADGGAAGKKVIVVRGRVHKPGIRVQDVKNRKKSRTGKRNDAGARSEDHVVVNLRTSLGILVAVQGEISGQVEDVVGNRNAAVISPELDLTIALRIRSREGVVDDRAVLHAWSDLDSPAGREAVKDVVGDRDVIAVEIDPVIVVIAIRRVIREAADVVEHVPVECVVVRFRPDEYADDSITYRLRIVMPVSDVVKVIALDQDVVRVGVAVDAGPVSTGYVEVFDGNVGGAALKIEVGIRNQLGVQNRAPLVFRFNGDPRLRRSRGGYGYNRMVSITGVAARLSAAGVIGSVPDDNSVARLRQVHCRLNRLQRALDGPHVSVGSVGRHIERAGFSDKRRQAHYRMDGEPPSEFKLHLVMYKSAEGVSTLFEFFDIAAVSGVRSRDYRTLESRVKTAFLCPLQLPY